MIAPHFTVLSKNAVTDLPNITSIAQDIGKLTRARLFKPSVLAY